MNSITSAPIPGPTSPRSYETITVAWLSNVLCHAVPGAAVVGHRLGPPDDGTNNRRRIHLSYNREGTSAGPPASVFCKATFGLANRQMLGHSGGVLCEVTFQNHARALLDIEDFGDTATFCSEETRSISPLPARSWIFWRGCTGASTRPRNSRAALACRRHGSNTFKS